MNRSFACGNSSSRIMTRLDGLVRLAIEMGKQKHDPFKLLFGPYHPPKTRPGRRLFCEIRGTVEVGGYSDGEIPWPRLKGQRSLILCGDLVKAVKFESNLAVCHAFGVCVQVVSKWRKALNVPRCNVGSSKLWARVESNRTDDRLERGRHNSKLPTALAKASASLKGRIQHPNTIEAVRKAAKRPRSEGWKKKMAGYWRKRGHPVGHPEREFWSAEDHALLGTAPDGEVAARLGRSYSAVHSRRIVFGIPPYFVSIDGRRLERLRTKSAMTQATLAKKVGISRGRLRTLEDGSSPRIRGDRAERLSVALRCDMSELCLRSV
jgi:DNA-binding XRE family transcriptional regulator